MPYKSLEDKKRYDQRFQQKNADELNKKRRERYRLKKEGLDEKSGVKKGLDEKVKGLDEKKKTKDIAVEVVDLKPGDRGYCNPEPYLNLRQPVKDIDSKDDKDAKPASSVVDLKKKSPVEAEAQEADNEKASEDLEELFNE